MQQDRVISALEVTKQQAEERLKLLMSQPRARSAQADDRIARVVAEIIGYKERIADRRERLTSRLL